ncbi:MAG: NAD(P)/FAD-dependent oxidoreductase [Eubacteriales bacterium]|nr:NAD(P)/FAD-dependent oxidoreductase [Eubacteriales bacterium]MDD3200045.1 NAD(P)/FAD-dependent oxidoreductase [Eubacteriales bacterium]MDD4630028.1 NAD(P)/FAD-dependent oxidoreductase [Eubacteriales bacterium]
MRQFDVLIIGAGAVGNAIAREISKNNMFSIAVLEKEPDTAFGISGRNSGVLHSGFNNKPGSLMAKLCVQGSEGFEREAEALRIPFKRTGKLVISRYEEDLERLHKLKEQGDANGVRELRILYRKELAKLLGYETGIAALWSGMTGIFDPFLYTVALAETAATQGTQFFFGRQVSGIVNKGTSEEGFVITAENLSSGLQETYQADVLINSAGLSADVINRMLGLNDYSIFPCRGEYHILDKNLSKELKIPVYPVPNEREGGLGVHLTPTIHGNLMIGPSAEYLSREQEREDYSVTHDVMEQLSDEGTNLFPGLDLGGCIRSFSGIRPKLLSEEEGGYADFVIEKCEQVPGYIRLIGIESPGLTSSIPIGKMVAEMAQEILNRNRNMDRSNHYRTQESQEKKYSGEHGHSYERGHNKTELSQIQKQGDQKMLCRCEGITEEAVLSAYDRILELGAIPTIKGLKSRTRVTMGNCQGSFCSLNIVELLQDKRLIDPMQLMWNGFESRMFEGRVRG